MSKLYIVGTPIGNLGDITYRAVETLRAVDFVCAEDTRVTAKLLNYLDIKKPLVSHHEHNQKPSCAAISERILSGEDCALVTDAGMPCISDPGEELVRYCAEKGIEIAVVPGPSAVISALAVSGLETSRFSFQGFLSVNRRSRFEQLENASKIPDTLIFYEAPHKLIGTLGDMLKYLGDRKISLCRELTKIHEQVLRTTISQALEYYTDVQPKGEYVLVIEGCRDEEKAETLSDAVAQAEALIDKGMRKSDAAKHIAKTSGFPKGEIYAALIDNAVLTENDKDDD